MKCMKSFQDYEFENWHHIVTAHHVDDSRSLNGINYPIHLPFAPTIIKQMQP